jgi:hypothetical protein
VTEQNPHDPAVTNPQQVTSQKRNRHNHKPRSTAVRERSRQLALATRPWERSTGPKTAAGKAQAALNGKTRQKGEKSSREKRAEVAEIGQLLKSMGALRTSIQAAQDFTVFDKGTTT